MNGHPPRATNQGVGYKRPPKEHQFKKGASGNPKGRPATNKPKRTAANIQLDQMVLEEALRPIQVRENDKLIELPMIQAVVRSLGVSAVKGHHPSQLALAAMVKAAQTQQFEELLEAFSAATQYKKRWRAVFEACDQAGRARPEPIPHPDEIILDEKALRVRFNGPTNETEKAEWDRMLSARQQMLDEISELQNLAEEGDQGGLIADDIAQNLKIVEIIDASVPDEETRRRPGFDLERWRESQPGHAHLTSAAKEHRRRGKPPS